MMMKIRVVYVIGKYKGKISHYLNILYYNKNNKTIKII